MWSRDFERFQRTKLNTFLLILMFKFALVQPWNIGVCRIDLVFVTELTVDLLGIKKAFDLVKIYLSFRIMLLNRWSVNISIFVSHVFIAFWGDGKHLPLFFYLCMYCIYTYGLCVYVCIHDYIYMLLCDLCYLCMLNHVLLCYVCPLFCLKSSSSMLYLHTLPTVNKNYVTLLLFNI